RACEYKSATGQFSEGIRQPRTGGNALLPHLRSNAVSPTRSQSHRPQCLLAKPAEPLPHSPPTRTNLDRGRVEEGFPAAFYLSSDVSRLGSEQQEATIAELKSMLA